MHDIGLASRGSSAGRDQQDLPCKVKPQRRDDIMYSIHQRLQARACRKLALEQNQRLLKQAHTLNSQAYALLDKVRPDLDTFEQYHLLRNKAEEKFQEANEHLQLVNREFGEPQASGFAPLLRTSPPKQASRRSLLQRTGR